MTKSDKNTDASKVELDDEQLDDVSGGPLTSYLKIGDIKGESRATMQKVSLGGNQKTDISSVRKDSGEAHLDYLNATNRKG